MMRGWETTHDGKEYYRTLYDSNYTEVMSVVFNPKEHTLKLDDFILSEHGIIKLRKMLAQVGRYQEGGE